jgi:CRISPR/Cas system CMR subunit Cmr6 (Cas7 group RAMP superfamily)
MTAPKPVGHLTLQDGWQYRQHLRSLSTDELLHLKACNVCLTLLGLCQTSKSEEEVKRRLQERDPKA